VLIVQSPICTHDQNRRMNEKPGDPSIKPIGVPEMTPEAAKGPETVAREATYVVQFSKFWSGSRPRNSYDLARRGEIVLSAEGVIVRAFRREMGFMGSRIELKFARADIADVSHLGSFLSLNIVLPNGNLQTLGFWAADEAGAQKIAQALPSTVSEAGAALKGYAEQLKLLDRGDYVTKALLAANILVFGAAGIAGAGFFVPNVEVLQAWGTNFGPLTTGGQWWRLVTSMFLHFGVFHLAFNMWALYVGGRLAERLFGGRTFALLYFASGLGGSLGSLLWNPAVNSAGASGAIFGVYGAMLAFYLRKHSVIPSSVIQQQRWSGIVFIGYNLMNGFSHAGIDNADHVGGLAVGFALGLVFARPLGLEARNQINAAWFYLRGGAAALAMIGSLFVGLRFSPAGNTADQRFRRDILAMSQSEAIAQKSAREALEQLQNHQITGKEFAERIDTDVLPRWEMIRRRLQSDRVADDSQLKPLWDLLVDYSESRLAAFQLFESGGRTGKSADFKAAQAKVFEGDVDLNLIKDFHQKR
jgi:rhomboid protease GluP